MTGKCPHCSSDAGIAVEAVRARDSTSDKTWPAVVFMCDQCRTILSVSLDPEWQATIVAGQIRIVDRGSGQG